MAKINSTGELRQFLANMMIGVKDGLVDKDDGVQIIGMAKAINDSFWSEVKVGKIRFDATGEKFRELGKMGLGEDDEAKA